MKTRQIMITGNDRRLGFTRVELMVVIGIIALLIAIVVPAVNSARIAAKVASTRSTIAAIEGGVDQFRVDSRVGGSYPPSVFGPVSSPHASGTINVGGASLVVWALVGADLLGSPGFRDIDGDGSVGDDTGTQLRNPVQASDLYAVYPNSYADASLRGKPVHYRQNFGIDTSKMKLSKQVALGEFVFPDLKTTQQTSVLPQSLCFLDAFGQPILYYRANPTAAEVVCDEPNPALATGIYNLHDNMNITGCGHYNDGVDLVGPGTGGTKLSAPYQQWYHYLPGPSGIFNDLSQKSFGRTVWNRDAIAGAGTVGRPHRPDSFILLSAGPDGRFGNSDDVANFPITD